MKKFIFGNFKMNMTLKDTEEYIDKFLPLVNDSKNEIVIFPSYTNLMFANQKLTSTKIMLGAQNISSENSGCFNSQISASMIKSVGCRYVIIGHSESRKCFYEKNEMLNKKIQHALSQGLKVVFCLGETKYERTNKKTAQVLQKDILEAFKGIYENELKNIIIAYEPIWSIGSGLVLKNKDIEKSVEIIRKEIKNEFSEKASENIKILYGGSVDINNAKTIALIKGVNGLLIGKSSLNPKEFSDICNIKF